MPHSYTKIWIHAIWATKERSPLIHLNVENKIHSHITEQLIEQECSVKIVNGMPDHIHCLFLLNPKKSVADVIKQIKGSCSHFVNQENIFLRNLRGKRGMPLIPFLIRLWSAYFNTLKTKSLII